MCNFSEHAFHHAEML